MKKAQAAINYFFVDESGDPYFYNRHGKCVVGKDGCSKILVLGFIHTDDPQLLRQRIAEVKEIISSDAYLSAVPSLKKSLKYFHATDDCPEVREKVFKSIIELPFKSECVVARKNEEVFINRHQRKPNLFYDDLISKLFQNQLHSSKENIIYFSVRTNRARQQPFEEAVKKAIFAFENKWNTKVETKVKVYPQRPQSEPCLQIIDYMLWAVQRAFIKKEDRYLNFVKAKISLIADIYDFKNLGKNFYSRRNIFDINKISPL